MKKYYASQNDGRSFFFLTKGTLEQLIYRLDSMTLLFITFYFIPNYITKLRNIDYQIAEKLRFLVVNQLIVTGKMRIIKMSYSN